MVKIYKDMKRVLVIILFLTLIMSIAMTAQPLSAQETDQKVVRVGWYESAFHRTDQFGRRSGYGYEYQQRVAIYTGWTYEYVEGSWSELLEKLIAGEIDLLSDVSYTPARAEKILYSSEAMGSEGYHVFISPENNEIRPDLFTSLNGKRVGVNKNSIQEQLFIEWAKAHDVSPEIIESTEKTPVLLEMLANGEFDALVTLDTYGNTADVVPVWKVGFAESYFGVNKNRPDLKLDLDVAMNQLIEDNRDFNQQLTDKYNKASSVNSFLTSEEKNWLSGHGTIRVGYRDNFLPFCDLDDEKQILTGALSDYLKFGETCEKNVQLTFETYPFTTTEEALQAMAAGEIDCVFPLSLSSYDGEKRGVIITDPLVSTEMYAIVRTADHQGISREREMTAAVVKGNPNYDTFLMDYFPNWKIAYYNDSQSVFQAVVSGEADCGLVSNYRINRLSSLFEEYNLSVLATDEVMDMPFAVSRENRYLYSILNKITKLMPDTQVNSSLTNYGFRDDKVTFVEYLRDNLIYFIASVAIVAVIFLLLVLRNARAEAKVEEGRQIISEAERDELTNLYNRNFFFVYANRIYRENPDKPMDAVVMNIDRFHSVNALYGREFGDRVLRELGEAIQEFLSENEGIASRFDADRFSIYCRHNEDWQSCLDNFQGRLDNLPLDANIHLRMGVKPWQAGMEPVQQFDRARIACNKVRGDFTAQVVIFDEAMEQQEDRDQRLLNDLSRALEQHELKVHYQPKYDIRPEKPKLSSAEALVRWDHPDLGLIHPDEFVSLFEQTGQISSIDNYVWEETARQIAVWRDQYGITLPVSVNLSRMDVFIPDLISKLDGILEKYGLTGKDLKLEVTESAYTENADQLITVIEQLRKKGYEIEMDDFGSGFSSLNMLSSMPIDVLKMDMAFIRNIERNEKDFRLVELIIDIARYLKVPVIAEGVETEKQLSLLKNAGCDLVQGFYFSRALPADEFGRKILAGLKNG
ncbi:MAG: EAL domain-containing protein [Anaerolineaceae bacterium]|nr:EAL domain-containing protein [Anaerolineaceae bacterium]